MIQPEGTIQATRSNISAGDKVIRHSSQCSTDGFISGRQYTVRKVYRTGIALKDYDPSFDEWAIDLFWKVIDTPNTYELW